jgi:hypothetical protein
VLMVIFGAGASYDSCSSLAPPAVDYQWPRPPLAKQLFLNVPKFRSVSKYYEAFQPLLPYLEDKANVEEILEEFRVKAETDAECRSQLWAIQYYLKGVIALCQSEWTKQTYGVSNYKTLLDQVRGCSRVCFVSFNYDTLMEEAFQGIRMPMGSISDYIADSKYSFFKLHGSIDWQLWVRKMDTDLDYNDQPTDQKMILAAPTVGDRFIIEKGGRVPAAAKGEIYFSLPALAIPTVLKQTFVCPKEHLEALQRIIPEVTKIAIVGWRAGEKHFLKMLKDGLRNPVKVIAACAGKEAAKETLDRFMAARIVTNDTISAEGGFSDFVVNRSIEPFLA